MSSPRLAIAPLPASDVPAALALHERAFGYAYPPDALRQDIASRQSAVLGAWDAGGRLVGFGVVRLLADAAHVMTIAVVPEARRRGHGRALLAGLRAAAVALGAHSITLEVRETNRAAIGLYRSAGLQEVGRRRRYYPDTGEDGLLLTEDL